MASGPRAAPATPLTGNALAEKAAGGGGPSAAAATASGGGGGGDLKAHAGPLLRCLVAAVKSERSGTVRKAYAAAAAQVRGGVGCGLRRMGCGEVVCGPWTRGLVLAWVYGVGLRSRGMHAHTSGMGPQVSSGVAAARVVGGGAGACGHAQRKPVEASGEATTLTYLTAGS